MSKVLIVDDDAIHRMVIARLAKQAGLTVTFAASAKEAVTALGSDAYPVITLDLNLGEEQGMDVLEHLAGTGTQSRVFLISGSLSEQHDAAIRFALRNGIAMVDFPKPINLTYLRECFEDCLNASKATSEMDPVI